MILSRKSDNFFSVKKTLLFSAILIILFLVFVKGAQKAHAKYCCDEECSRITGECVCVEWCSGAGGEPAPPPAGPPPSEGGVTPPAGPPAPGGGGGGPGPTEPPGGWGCPGDCCTGSDCPGGCVCCGATCDDPYNPGKGDCANPAACVCFTGETEVEVKEGTGETEGTKKIKDIKIGDKVDCFDKNGEEKICGVTEIHGHQSDHYYLLQTATDRKVKTTQEHPFLAVSLHEAIDKGGPNLERASFIRVKNLSVGDWVFVEGGSSLVAEQITKLERHNESTEVYNLSVDGEETFFASGFAVHNKEGFHETVCDLTLAPKLSTAQTETWRIGDTGTWLDGEGNFKGLFRWDNGMGPSGNGFHEQAGDKICLWGTVVGSCQYPAREDGNPCRNCKQNCGTACACSKTPGCNPTCEMTCGLGVSFLWLNEGPGHEAGPDRIRFRSGYTYCDGCGCGRAIKVTAPSGYIIKSITADIKSRMHSSADPKIDGHLYFSRGMHYGDECGMMPRWVYYGVPNWYDGRPTIGFGGGTKYFFIYHRVTSAGVGDSHSVGIDLRDNWAELSNIALEVVKIGEVKGNEVTVINNSLLRYDGVNIDNPDESRRWPAITWGSFQYWDGSVWSANLGWKATYDINLPSGASGPTSVYAYVSSQDARICQAGPIDVQPKTGKIWGKVYKDEFSTCASTDSLGQDWKATCAKYSYDYDLGQWVLGSEIDAKEDSNSQYTCLDDKGSDQLLQGSFYQIKFYPPAGWNKVTCPITEYWVGAQEGPYTMDFYVEMDDEEIPTMYLWQGYKKWFQTEGGDVYAEGNISSQIPPSPSPDPYFSLRVGGVEKTAGVVTSFGTRDYAMGEDLAGVVSLDGWEGDEDSALFEGGSGKYNYAYYKSLLAGETTSLALAKKEGKSFFGRLWQKIKSLLSFKIGEQEVLAVACTTDCDCGPTFKCNSQIHQCSKGVNTCVVNCNEACAGKVCNTGLQCIGEVCRNPDCQDEASCVCPTPTPTPEPTPEPTPGPTEPPTPTPEPTESPQEDKKTTFSEETGNHSFGDGNDSVSIDDTQEAVNTLNVSGKKLVYLVDGDLVIKENVTVEKGAFLAFIISGNITIESGVTILEGIYIADGTISTGTVGGDTADSQLALNGTFVGYGGFSLERDLKENNTTTPANVFTYRPDFIVNAPEGLFSISYTWKQVAPEANP